MKRPSNHVTKAADAFRAPLSPTLPLLDRHQLEHLERLYPPRCLGRAETVEEHLRYSGQVELVERLRARFEASREDTDEGDPLLDGEDAQQQQER